MADSFVQLEPDSTGKKAQAFENLIGTDTVEAIAVAAVDPIGMAASYVQVQPDNTGKKVQYFVNTIGGNEVYALAVVAVDSSGSPI